MELQNLRLQALQIADGDIEKAKAMESYVLGNQEAEKVTEPQAESSADDKGNTGDRNTGNWNTGYSNTGDRNTGNWNTGNWNTGDRNTGNWNTGYSNTGDRNTGNWNTGYSNTGDWNATNFSNGFFNTEEVEIINVFDKPCMKSVWDEASKPECLYFSLTEWIFESEMSDVEKQENPSFSCTGGYLKKYDYKEAFTKSVTEASKEERDLIRALPNFNNEKFLEISGVDLSQLD
ncbi:pentapeptide repeat-containing protein [Acinetobacter piscicola]|uniref:pentapeptide repeat-containing protein n=1 Tax=Acinetobacter piscicola TaxID=2006115 RepID=UPI00102281CC|nr:hypothetical protein [Acinetobacter piscicola]RYL25086.1 hypothetical protein EWP19_12935 [Acinetobacter piscicola]